MYKVLIGLLVWCARGWCCGAAGAIAGLDALFDGDGNDDDLSAADWQAMRWASPRANGAAEPVKVQLRRAETMQMEAEIPEGLPRRSEKSGSAS